MTGVFLGLLLKQPDLGTAVIIGVTALGLMFVAGTRTSYILIAVLIAAPLGWKIFITGESWRMKRLLAFLYPWQYRRDTGYQLYESLISIGSGGVWGQGLGQGHQKLFFLPEAHTDFILAVVGEPRHHGSMASTGGSRPGGIAQHSERFGFARAEGA